MSLIQLKDVYKIYAEGQENQVNALDGVTLSIDQGEFVAIIGTSGSGKSTMMNILGCLDVPTRGEYLLDGTPIRERTQRELSQIRSRQIAFIFQGYNLIPSLNVWQNVALPMLYQRVPLAERRARAMEALEKVEIAAKADNRPAQLSIPIVIEGVHHIHRPASVIPVHCDVDLIDTQLLIVGGDVRVVAGHQRHQH